MTPTKWIKFAMAAGLALSLGLILWYINNSTLPLGEKQKTAREYGGAFTLQGQSGPVSLSDFQGKVVIIYFGFLSCTEACPRSMGVITNAFQRLTEEELAQLQAIFISVDPKRDTVDGLEEFANYYHSSIIGLTGSQQEVDEITRQYGVFFELVDLEGSALSYTVDHSSRFYMINKKGELVTTMSHSTTPNELVARIRQLIKEEL